MFKFLKEKIKQAIGKITSKVEEEIPEKLEVAEVKKEEVIELHAEEPSLHSEITRKIEKLEEFDKDLGKKELDKSIVVDEVAEAIQEGEKHEKIGFLGKLKEKIVTKKIDEGKFNEFFWDLELALLENNVAVEVVEKIKADLKRSIVDRPIKRGEVDSIVETSLRDSIEDLFDVGKIDVIEVIKKKKDKPYVIVFLGINGSGKTTTISKLAKKILDNKMKCVLVAGDTWRQAAIEQLEEHGRRLGIKVIRHGYGADPAAVCFDGIQHAKAKRLDVVLVDTAGRLHSNVNLMQEMKKIVRVAKPDLKIFVGESITGNDAVEQARKFDEAVGIDGIILTKADVDEKGGAAVSIGYVTKKPILYLGVGQTYDSLKEFNKEEVIKSIGLNE